MHIFRENMSHHELKLFEAGFREFSFPIFETLKGLLVKILTSIVIQ